MELHLSGINLSICGTRPQWVKAAGLPFATNSCFLTTLATSQGSALLKFSLDRVMSDYKIYPYNPKSFLVFHAFGRFNQFHDFDFQMTLMPYLNPFSQDHMCKFSKYFCHTGWGQLQWDILGVFSGFWLAIVWQHGNDIAVCICYMFHVGPSVNNQHDVKMKTHKNITNLFKSIINRLKGSELKMYFFLSSNNHGHCIQCPWNNLTFYFIEGFILQHVYLGA